MKTIYILLLPIIVLLVLIGLNYRQIISAWMIHAETSRLEKSAMDAPEEFQTRTAGGKFSGREPNNGVRGS